MEILGTVAIYILAEVLGSDGKQLEVAVIHGQEYNKEILVSLRLMKAWNGVHMSFPRESVTSYMLRMMEANKLDKYYISYHSIKVNESKPVSPPSKKCELLRDKIKIIGREGLKKSLKKVTE